MRRWLVVVLSSALWFSGPRQAHAQDTDDDFDFEDGSDDRGTAPPKKESEDEEEEDSEDAPPPEESSEGAEDDEFLFEDEVDEEGERVEEDLFEGEETTEEEVLAPGTDNATVYRAKSAEFAMLAPDEEVMAWEGYLEEYPNSIFRERIQQRIDELVDQQFRMRIEDEGGGVDADAQEILLVTPLHMTNLNPRTKIQVGLEFGFPGHIVANADFEYAVLRNVSVHGGVVGRYYGWGLEAGTRYAFVKSTRLQLVATLIADVRLNFNELFFQVRPQIGFGKILGPAQILVSFGSEIETRKNATVALIGGAHVGVRLAPPVGMFVETDFHVRDLAREAGVLTFDVVSFGLRFYPGMKKRTDDPVELHAGGHFPAASQYLSYYQGAVQAQGIYYMPSRR